MHCVEETPLYKIILSIIMIVPVVYCSGTSNWQNYCKVGISLVIFGDFVAHLRLSKSAQANTVDIGDIPLCSHIRVYIVSPTSSQQLSSKVSE